MIFRFFDQLYLELVLQHTILQNSLYKFLKNLLLKNILHVIRFLFARRNCSLFMAFNDIESLFTNMPLDQTRSIGIDQVFQNKRKETRLLKRHFKHLFTFAVKCSCLCLYLYLCFIFILFYILYSCFFYIYIFLIFATNKFNGVAVCSLLGPRFPTYFLFIMNTNRKT